MQRVYMKANQVERIITKTFLVNGWIHLIFLMLFLAAACGLFDSKGPAEPAPGRRDYTWTVDSVYSAPGGWMNAIWGASANDVWIGSAGGLDRLWHYDGKKWKPWPKHMPSIESLYGFASDNIWMGTMNGSIYHYDGKEWSKVYTYTIQGMGEPDIFDLWGTSPSNIYAVGTVLPDEGPPYRGFVLHYDGKNWKQLLVTDFGVQLQRVRDTKQGVFIRGVKSVYVGGAPDTLVLYQYSKGRLHELLSMPENDESAMIWVNNIGGNAYILNRKELLRYSKGKFIPVTEFPSPKTVYSFFGRSIKDVFVITSDGLLHYNGTDTKFLIDIIAQPNALLLKNDVFFFVNDYKGGTNLIYHGTLTPEEE